MRTLERLRAWPASACTASPTRRGPTSARRRSASPLDRRSPRETAEALGREGIFTWDGNYYALEAIRALGLEATGGALRAGYLHYTTVEEVDRFLDRLEALAAG